MQANGAPGTSRVRSPTITLAVELTLSHGVHFNGVDRLVCTLYR